MTAVESQTTATQAQGTSRPQQTQAAEPPSESTPSAVAAEAAPNLAAQDLTAAVPEGQAASEDEELVNEHLPENRSALAEQAHEAVQAAGNEPGTSKGAAAAEQPQPGKAEAGQKPSGLVQQAGSNLLHGFRSLIPMKTAPAPLLGGGKKAPEVGLVPSLSEAMHTMPVSGGATVPKQARELVGDLREAYIVTAVSTQTSLVGSARNDHKCHMQVGLIPVTHEG